MTMLHVHVHDEHGHGQRHEREYGYRADMKKSHRFRSMTIRYLVVHTMTFRRRPKDSLDIDKKQRSKAILRDRDDSTIVVQ